MGTVFCADVFECWWRKSRGLRSLCIHWVDNSVHLLLKVSCVQKLGCCIIVVWKRPSVLVHCLPDGIDGFFIQTKFLCL